VVGVVRNMVMTSPYEQARQTLFFMDSKPGNFLIIRLKPQSNVQTDIQKIEAIYKKYSPSEPVDFRFVDMDYQSKFSNEQKIGKLAGIFSMLAILISCMGIFGMSVFIAEQRIKEIGVRKILGASVFSLWRMLSLDFVILVSIALIIAAPMAWTFMTYWLNHYAYRIKISWWMFVAVGICVIAITLLTVSYQTLKIAVANPIKSLKSE